MRRFGLLLALFSAGVATPRAAFAQDALADRMSKARALREADPTFFGVRGTLSPWGRVDAGTYAPPQAAFGLGLSLRLRPWPFAAFGVTLSHDWLGFEQPPAAGTTAFSVWREVTTGWLDAEIVPFPMRRHAELGPFDPFVAIGLGLAGEHLSMRGQFPTGPFGTAPVVPVSCSGDAGPGIGIRGALGARGKLTRDGPKSSAVRSESGLWVTAQLGFEITQLGANDVAQCARGAGTVMRLGATMGFEYEWNTSGGQSR